MALENLDVIDVISINSFNKVVLTISDHYEWDDKNFHITLLKEKINCYLNIIENGNIYKIYEKALNKNFIIQVVLLFSPNEAGKMFFNEIENLLKLKKIELVYYQMENFK